LGKIAEISLKSQKLCGEGLKTVRGATLGGEIEKGVRGGSCKNPQNFTIFYDFPGIFTDFLQFS